MLAGAEIDKAGRRGAAALAPAMSDVSAKSESGTSRTAAPRMDGILLFISAPPVVDVRRTVAV